MIEPFQAAQPVVQSNGTGTLVFLLFLVAIVEAINRIETELDGGGP